MWSKETHPPRCYWGSSSELNQITMEGFQGCRGKQFYSPAIVNIFICSEFWKWGGICWSIWETFDMGELKAREISSGFSELLHYKIHWLWLIWNRFMLKWEVCVSIKSEIERGVKGLIRQEEKVNKLSQHHINIVRLNESAIIKVMAWKHLFPTFYGKIRRHSLMK